MDLRDTLFSFETYLNLQPDSLLPFADVDTIGGYHPEPSQRQWGAGAIWDVEGRALYALIRALKPAHVVEIGSGTGCSTTHVASALDANGYGHVTTIDRGNTPHIPEHLTGLVTVLAGDAIEWLEQQPDNSINFILEDADHSEAMCFAIGELAQRKLTPGGVLLSHDAAHFGVGADVRAGYTRAGLTFRVYLTEPSDCGWLIYQRPIEINDDPVLQAHRDLPIPHPDSPAWNGDDDPVLQAQEDVAPAPKPKPKRKPARKAAKK